MFRFFRRYQKTFIVVGGVILMFVFTVGDSLTAWMRSRENTGDLRDPNATAVTWDGGELTERELDTLLGQRQLVSRFVQMVYTAGLERAAMAGREDLAPRVLPVGLVNEEWNRNEFEGEVLLTHILAERGDELGIRISDNAVTEYINELGRGELGSDDIRSILSAINPSRPPSADAMYDALRHELLAAAVARSYGAGASTQDMFAAELPINRWEQWKRVNDRVVIEAAAIDPSTSLIDVPEPTDAQLREYYELHKNRVDFPVRLSDGTELPSPTPGFKIPRKVRLQYLRANYDEFVERYAGEVTEEQIAEYYEENKFRFVEADSLDDILGEQPSERETSDRETPEGEPSEGEMPEAGADESSESSTQEPNSEEPNTEQPSTDDSGEGESSTAAEGGDAPPAEAPSSAEEPAPEEPATEEPATDDEVSDAQPADNPEAEGEPATEEPEQPESAQHVPTSPFRLVAYQPEASEQGPDNDTQTVDTDAADTKPPVTELTETGTSDSDTTDESTEVENPASEVPASQGADTQSSTDESSTEQDMTDTAGAVDTVPGEDMGDVEVKYQPLEEVADKIRRNIAEDRFFNEIDGNMQTIVSRINPAFNSYLNAKLDAEALDQQPPEAPEALLDLTPFAQEFSLELEETGELNALELRDTPVGKSVGEQKYSGVPVWQLMFAADVDMYEPIISADIGRFGDRYLVMKLADEPERIPQFEEIKDQVAQEWKMQEAAKLALEKAKATAARAEEAELSLKDFFVDSPEVEVTTTPPFTQLTEGDVAPASGMPSYRLSQPNGLQAIGPEFLNEVFKLSQGEVTALANHDSSIIYVVRLADEFESVEQLRSDFLEQANFWPGRYVFRNSNAQASRNAALAAMLENINVEWQRDDADTIAEEQADDESEQ